MTGAGGGDQELPLLRAGGLLRHPSARASDLGSLGSLCLSSGFRVFRGSLGGL